MKRKAFLVSVFDPVNRTHRSSSGSFWTSCTPKSTANPMCDEQGRRLNKSSPDLGVCVFVWKRFNIQAFTTLIWLRMFSHLLSSPRISEEAAAMWKKHLERDDSRIVGKESKSSRGDPSVWSVQPLMILATRLSQTCSLASCGARCTAQCAPTIPTHSMCSVICLCPSPREALAARSRWGSVWTSSLRRRNWTRRIHQWVNTERDKLMDYNTKMVSKFGVKGQ